MVKTALFFHADAVESKDKEIVGRRSSGQSFLKGYLRHVGGDIVHGVTETKSAADTFENAVRDLGDARPVSTRYLRGADGFADLDTVFFPGPGFLGATWRRQRFNPKSCSLVGITHTVSTRRVIEGLHGLISEPVEDWDAVICTSRAVQSVVREQFLKEAEYFQTRFGAKRVPMPQLPLIPLGINTDDFSRSDDNRKQMRDRFETPDDAAVVMTMGRFTSVEKANPVPLFLALEQVAQRADKPVHLWLVGWASRENEEELHRKGAAALCPSVTVHFVDGTDPEIRRKIWSGADIFTLPVDNIQETFGLVPVEAMAAGLPVVMPDWDGFRDTVVHGETGYLIPTLMTAPGGGPLIAQRFADGTDDYLRYLSIVQQQTVIDLHAYTDAFMTLINDPEKRLKMGEAGQRHVQKNFDWAQIIPRYLDLASELKDRRDKGTVTTPPLGRGAINPIEIDPFHLYRTYPTGHPNPQMVVASVKPLDAKALNALDRLNGRDLYNRRVIPDPMLLQVAAAVDTAKAATILKLAQTLDMNVNHVTVAVLFLAKFGYVQIDTIAV